MAMSSSNRSASLRRHQAKSRAYAVTAWQTPLALPLWSRVATDLNSDLTGRQPTTICFALERECVNIECELSNQLTSLCQTSHCSLRHPRVRTGVRDAPREKWLTIDPGEDSVGLKPKPRCRPSSGTIGSIEE